MGKLDYDGHAVDSPCHGMPICNDSRSAGHPWAIRIMWWLLLVGLVLWALGGVLCIAREIWLWTGGGQ